MEKMRYAMMNSPLKTCAPRERFIMTESRIYDITDELMGRCEGYEDEDRGEGEVEEETD